VAIEFSGIPFNPDDLINLRSFEGNRVEFKATWNQHIKIAVLRSICAFANDLLNLNGGYIILGVEEAGGLPILPSRGLEGIDIDALQREIRGACARINPVYYPVMFPLIYQEKPILIIMAPGSDNRPHQAPENVTQKGSQYEYFVRQGACTVMARGLLLNQLMEMAAKIPFDDRRSLQATIEDISPTLVRRYLHSVRSELVLSNRFDDQELYKRLRITIKINAHEVPRNIGLLFFNEDPDVFFPGARIEVVQFGDDAGGDLIEEKVFKGPLPEQIRSTLEYLDSLGGSMINKIRGQAEVERTVPYPYEAMEEALVNAVYHRGYDGPPEPIKVYLYPDRMEFTSYPGPVQGIQLEQFAPDKNIPQVAARNRRIGAFLKELRLAEARGTGIPKIQRKMLENGSPQAIFDFDETRTYFRVIFSVHPRYQVLNALREASHLWAIGEKRQAVNHLERAFERQVSSGALASQLIEYAFSVEDSALAQRSFKKFDDQHDKREQSAQPYLTMARILIDNDQVREANEILGRIPKSRSIDDTVEAAILMKRARDFIGAHHLFSEAYAINPDDPKIIHEFAQTKINLARDLVKQRDIETKKKLNKEAVELLRRAIQLTDDPRREAWCWFDLARTLDWLRSSISEVETAYLKAISLLPEETRFRNEYRNFLKRHAH
jgi:ATP-dependent DNA helicase RecG